MSELKKAKRIGFKINQKSLWHNKISSLAGTCYNLIFWKIFISVCKLSGDNKTQILITFHKK